MPAASGEFALVLATRNQDKIREIRAILGDLPVRLLSPPDVEEWDEPDETGSTLEENAQIKARAVYEATGVPAVADDTGLEVAALGGAPGVYSSRFSGPDATYASNCAKLLDDLDGVVDRSARFRTVVATAGIGHGSDDEIIVDGILDGSICLAAQGDGGFGYDPIFLPEDEKRSLAELSIDEKNAISHRGRAFRAFADALGARIQE